MTISLALLITILISLVISTVLIVAMSKSLHTTLVDTSDSIQSATYWVPYSIAITYLVPLFVGLLIGVGTVPEAGGHPAASVSRILVSILGGCLLALGGIGLQLSKHNQRITNLRLTRPAGRSARDAREFD